MPEPVNMINNHELSSNFDSDLDLTVLENRETEILDNCNMKDYEFKSDQLKSQQNLTDRQHMQISDRVINATPTSTVTTVGTSSVSVSIATSVPIAETTSSINTQQPVLNKSQNQGKNKNQSFYIHG